jgi:hypothetical protein
MMNWETFSKEIRIRNWLILMVLGGLSFIFMKPVFTMGVFLGGLIIIANFNALQHTIRGAFSADEGLHGKKVSIIVKFYFRLAMMGIIIYILIGCGRVDPVGLVLGLSVVVISIITVAVWPALNRHGWTQ